eukprot:6230588-Prymnesium_polylepis.1
MRRCSPRTRPPLDTSASTPAGPGSRWAGSNSRPTARRRGWSAAPLARRSASPTAWPPAEVRVQHNLVHPNDERVPIARRVRAAHRVARVAAAGGCLGPPARMEAGADLFVVQPLDWPAARQVAEGVRHPLGLWPVAVVIAKADAVGPDVRAVGVLPRGVVPVACHGHVPEVAVVEEPAGARLPRVLEEAD